MTIDHKVIHDDHRILAELLASRRTVTVETLPAGARLLWSAYLVLLEDGVKILTSLLKFLEKRS